MNNKEILEYFKQIAKCREQENKLFGELWFKLKEEDKSVVPQK